MTIHIVSKGRSPYREVARFAQARYAQRLQATISADPDAFSYVHDSRQIVGSFGIYLARPGHPLTLEQYYPGAFEHIAESATVERRCCAELGTRAALKVTGARSIDISIALTAKLLLYALAQGVQYVCFTSNRTVHALAAALKIELIDLGEPDLSRCDEAFRENWRAFFAIRQRCFGIKLDALEGCLSALQRLESRGIWSVQNDGTC